MFLASGGTLEVAGTGCFALLGICAVKRVEKTVKAGDYIVFLVAVLGAVLNTAAPGNFIRHSAIDESGLHIGSAIIFTCSQILGTLEKLLLDTPFIIIIVISLIVGGCIRKDRKMINHKIIGIICTISILMPFVTCFPVCLGYSKDVFSNRCEFIETVILTISIEIIVIVFGYLFYDKLTFLRKIETYFVLILFCIVIVQVNSSWKISESVPVQMWQQISKGMYRDYYNEVKDFYDKIASDTNDDVFLYDLPESSVFMKNVNISQDMSYWINCAIAEFYGKKSVQYVTEAVVEQVDGKKNIRISPVMFGNRSGYVSVFKIDSVTQETEALTVLQPLDVNILITLQSDEHGKIVVYLFADSEGKEYVDEREEKY